MDPGDIGNIDRVIDQVLTEVAACVGHVSNDSLAQSIELMETAPRIFVAGVGRSGLCMRAFAVRLVHLGKTVHVVGETTTPGITSKDLLILGSGSGRSPVLFKIAEMAREQGARIMLFTAETVSTLSEIADLRVIIPAPSFEPVEAEHKLMSEQPMGALFEQSLLILGDSLVLVLMDRLGVGVGKMRQLHANLE